MQLTYLVRIVSLRMIDICMKLTNKDSAAHIHMVRLAYATRQAPPGSTSFANLKGPVLLECRACLACRLQLSARLLSNTILLAIEYQTQKLNP